MNDKIKFTKGIGLWIFTREKKKKKIKERKVTCVNLRRER